MAIKIYDPKYGSKLTSAIFELEKLRVKKLGGPVSPHVFFQIKDIFQMLESLGSARIEGNNTTLAEYVEKIIEGRSKKTIADEKFKEIENIDKAINFIEKNVTGTTKFNRQFISEIHKILVNELTPQPKGEGSLYPGDLRPINVSIKGSTHKPPEAIKVPELFDELMNFVNQSL